MKLALVGTGLIGGSFALALRAAGQVEHVIGCDRERARAERARARGILDEVAGGVAEAACAADLVLLAVPVGQTEAVCDELGPALGGRPEVVVTDVGSTKVEVLRAVARALPGPERFVGGHPLAGTERSGPEAANAELFRGRTCLLTPTAETRPEARAKCAQLWQSVGARVLEVEAEQHDEWMALTSHLPHLGAFALASAVGGAIPAAARGLAGGGFVDTTRIAASDPTMWRDIFLGNREPLLAALARLEGELGAFRRAVEAGDGEALAALIAKARAGRRWVLGEPG